MASFGARRGAAGNGSLPLMIVTFLVIGGFLAWLNVKAESTSVVTVIEGSGPDSVSIGSATVVEVETFGLDPMALGGLVIRLNDLSVQGALGRQAFFVDIPNQPGPYLIKMGARVVADSVVVPGGAIVTVIGRVFAMSDSVADAWVAEGALTENDKILATFAESYLEAADLIMLSDGGGDGGDGN